MTDFANYPTSTDIKAMLMSASYWPTDATKQTLAEVQAAIAADAIKDEWERRTGWKPFLSTSAATSEWFFDTIDHNGEVDLEGGFISITTVETGSYSDGTWIGTAQTLNSQYATLPRNAIPNGQPITRLNFGYGGRRYGWPGYSQVRVIGRRGYCTELPADVWQTLLSAAALIALVGVENLQSIASIGMDGFNKAFDVVGIITQKDLLGVWAKNLDIRVQQYLRVVT